MVNLSALQMISRIIKDLKPMKKWSNRKRRDQSGKLLRNIREMSNQVRNVLQLISGNDMVAMLNGNKLFFKIIQPHCSINKIINVIDVLYCNDLESLIPSKYKNSLVNMALHYNKTNLKNRHHIIRPFRAANFRYSYMKRVGFKVSRPLWNSCLNSTERNLGD
jgi:hypothetical protein